MARRDVDLVIRARNEAERVLKAVTAELGNLVDAQKEVGESGERVESRLSRLGTVLGNLDKQFKGVTATARLNEQLNALSTNLERLEGKSGELAAEQLRLAEATSRSTQQAAKLKQEMAEVARVMEGHEAAVKEAETAQQGLNRALKGASAERKNAASLDSRLASEMKRLQTEVKNAEVRFDGLATKIKSAEGPTKTLQSQLDAAGRALERKRAALTAVTQQYEFNKGAIQAAGAAEGYLKDRIQQTAAILTNEKAALASVTEEHRHLQGAVQASAANVRQLEAQAARVGEAFKETSAELTEARQAVAAFGQTSIEASQALSRLAQQGSQNLARGFLEFRREVDESRNTMLMAKAAATELGRAYHTAEQPTEDLEIAFNETREAARRATEEYQANVKALQQLRQLSFRQVGPQKDPLGSLSRDRSEAQRILADLAQERQQIEANSQARQRAAVAGRSATAAARELGVAVRGAGQAAEDATRPTSKLADLWELWAGKGRTTMSMMQRLRGEVLSYIAAFAGISGAVNAVQKTVDTFRQLEAAQSRINVATGGDMAQNAKEMAFIRAEANRLGIEFGVLAGEYGKFLIATKNTNMEGENARKIFVAISEAARVNKLSMEDVRGTFVALTQMVSKGKISAEELNQQLAERIPGAAKLMAQALNVSTAELFKMMEQGQVTSDALIPFAEQLSKQFGPGLTEALKGTEAQIGRFKNAATAAFETFGNSQFMERFNAFLREMADLLQTSDAQAFFRNLGIAMGKVMDVLAALGRNFQAVFTILAAFTGVKVAQSLALLVPSFVGLSTTVGQLPGKLNATAAAMGTVGTASRVATGAVTGLIAAFRTLTVGTVIGAGISAVFGLFAYLATSADNATKLVDEHKKSVDRVKEAYDKAGGSAEKFAKALKDISVTETRGQLKGLQDELKVLTKQMEMALPGGTRGMLMQDATAQLRSIFQAFKDGIIDAQQLKESMDALAEANPKLDKDIVAGLIERAEKMKDVQAAIKEQELVLKVLTGTEEEALAAMKELRGETEKTAEALGVKGVDGAAKFEESLNKIKEMIPELAAEMKQLKELGDLDALVKIQPKTIEDFQRVLDLYSRARGAINEKAMSEMFGGGATGTMTAKTAALLRQFEGFQPTAKWDRNAFRAGFGSDTVTLADGSIQKIVQGMTVTMADAERDLGRRIQEFAGTVKGQIGDQRFNAFTPEQQAALTSIAYNYGSLPDRIVEAVRTGSATEIANAVRGLAGDNKGINAGRRNTEAAILERGGAGLAESNAELARKRAEDEAKAAEKTKERLADGKAELAQATLVNQHKERQAAIEKEVAEAVKENKNITAEQIEQVRQLAAAKWDQLHATDGAKAAEERVNQLMTVRSQLTEQLQLYQQQGDLTAMQNTQTALEQINAQLQEAITKAIQMWQAIGGPEADAAVAKLQTQSLSIRSAAKTAWLDWNQVGQLFASGLTNAFDQFAQKVAEGKSIGEAAREAFLQFASDFLRQIAQMIIQQAILNALRSFFPGMGFGASVGVGHGGGIAGTLGRSRRVDPSIFAGAMRYHNGGVPGLRSGEVPAILQRNEEVLTRADPRHILNGGGATAAPAAAPSGGDVKIINAFDTASFLEEAINSRAGEKALLNFVRANPGAFKQAMSGGGTRS